MEENGTKLNKIEETENYFNLSKAQLISLLIEKHKNFLNVYTDELKNIKKAKVKEEIVKKSVEILPYKKDLFEYWIKNLEEELETSNDKEIKAEIIEKISKLKEEIRKSELEFSAKIKELEEFENENKEYKENREEWLARRIESHKKMLNFWENYKIKDE